MISLDALKPYKLAIELTLLALSVLGLVAGIASAVHHYNAWQQGIGETRVRAEWEAVNKVAAQAQREREDHFQKDVDNAQAQAAQARQQGASAAVAAANTGRLFNDAITAIRAGAGSASIDALRANVAALTAVLPECERRYREVAQAADGHAADSLMYQRAWPRTPPASASSSPP